MNSALDQEGEFMVAGAAMIEHLIKLLLRML